MYADFEYAYHDLVARIQKVEGIDMHEFDKPSSDMLTCKKCFLPDYHPIHGCIIIKENKE